MNGWTAYRGGAVHVCHDGIDAVTLAGHVDAAYRSPAGVFR
jgi:hypothetical protein